MFTEGYGTERAFRDGQASEDEALYNLIIGLENSNVVDRRKDPGTA